MNRKAFVVLVASMFISMMGMGLVTPFLPIYANTMGATGVQVGLIQAAFSITGIGTLLFVGRLSDRYGRKSFLSAGLTILAIASFGLLYASSPKHLILWRFFQGLGASAHLPIAQAYLGDITPKGSEGKWMGYFSAVLFSGMGAGPLLGGVIADVLSMRASFLIMALLNILGLIATLLFLKEMPRKAAAREHSSYMAPLKSRIMRGIFVYRMTAGLGTASLMAFLPLFAELKLGLSTTLIGIVLAARTPASIVQSYTGGLADRWNRRSMVFWGGMATVFATVLLPSTAGFWTLLAVHIFTILGQSFGIPAANAFIVDEGRTYGMGASMTMFMLAMQIGNGIGPVALGGVSDRLGLNAVFYSAAVVMTSGIFLCDWILRRSTAQMSGNGK
ncbi:MAG: MFS transporter [Acidobacteria bacterium]|nr:MFS transporter [Acidobacteriota bacterium]